MSAPNIITLCGADPLCTGEATHMVRGTRLGGRVDFAACARHVQMLQRMPLNAGERARLDSILDPIDPSSLRGGR